MCAAERGQADIDPTEPGTEKLITADSDGHAWLRAGVESKLGYGRLGADAARTNERVLGRGAALEARECRNQIWKRAEGT